MFSQASVSYSVHGEGVDISGPISLLGKIGIPDGKYCYTYPLISTPSKCHGHLVASTKTVTVSKRVVRILLECFLVDFLFRSH